MYRSYDRNPAWYRDAKWLSGILLVLALAASLLLFSLASLSRREQAEPVLESVLRLSLLPTGGEDLELAAVQSGFDYTPGQPLRLLPGVDVFADPTELPGFDTEDGRSRIAGILSERIITGGAGSALELVSDATLRRQLEAAFVSPLPLMYRSLLAERLLPAGLDDGSRLANWQLQAQNNPGEPVQPIVGVFIRLPVAQLQGLNNRELGEFIVAELADISLQDGLAAAQDVITNINLEQGLTETVNQEIRGSLHDFVTTLLLGRDTQMASRLEQARELLEQQAAAQTAQEQFLSLAGDDEVLQLPAAEANRAVLRNLASLSYLEGPDELIARVAQVQPTEALEAARAVLEAVSAERRAQYVRFAWLSAIAALVLAALLLFFSAGLARLLNLGLAVVLGAGLGAFGFWRLERWQQGVPDAQLPSSLERSGVFGYLGSLLRALGSSLPDSAFALLLRNHLLVLLVGAGLVALYLLLRLWQLLRPRRRSLF